MGSCVEGAGEVAQTLIISDHYSGYSAKMNIKSAFEPTQAVNFRLRPREPTEVGGEYATIDDMNGEIAKPRIQIIDSKGSQCCPGNAGYDDRSPLKVRIYPDDQDSNSR